MEVNKWIDNIIRMDERFSLPIMTHPGIELIGHSIRQAVQDGNIHANAIKTLNDRFPAVALTTMMDLTVEAEAFGCTVTFPKNDMPHIIGRLMDSVSVENLKIPDLSAGRIPEYLKAVRLMGEFVPDKPTFSGVIGPFTLAGRLYGMSEIMVDCYLNPTLIHLLLSKCTKFILAYCTEMKRIGSPGVIMAEPAAGLLANEDCLQFSSVYIRQIADALQDDHFLLVLHNCGNSGQCTHAMLQTGANAYHFGNAISMIDALKACPSDVLVLGNIDPVGVLKMKQPEEIKQVVIDLLQQTKCFPNFVLSTGCDVPPWVPLANIQAYYDALFAFNQKSRLPHG